MPFLQMSSLLPRAQMYRGYFGTDKVGSSYKEAFEVGKDYPVDDPDYLAAFPISEHTPYPFPDEGEDPTPYNKYRLIMLRYYDILQGVSTNLLQLIAAGLGLDEHYFDSLFTKSVSTFRIINYPKHDFDIPKDAYGSDGKLQSTAPHRDTSVLTLLSTFDYEGLQVCVCVCVLPMYVNVFVLVFMLVSVWVCRLSYYKLSWCFIMLL